MSSKTSSFGEKLDFTESFRKDKNVAITTKLDKNMTLEFKDFSLEQNDVWFIKTNEGQNYAVLPEQMLDKILDHIKKQNDERIKAILRQHLSDMVPLDLEDAVAVALLELKNLQVNKLDLQNMHPKTRASLQAYGGNINKFDSSSLNTLLIDIADEVKAKYPHLFVNLRYISGMQEDTE